jgi:hypothetical protein
MKYTVWWLHVLGGSLGVVLDSSMLQGRFSVGGLLMKPELHASDPRTQVLFALGLFSLAVFIPPRHWITSDERAQDLDGLGYVSPCVLDHRLTGHWMGLWSTLKTLRPLKLTRYVGKAVRQLYDSDNTLRCARRPGTSGNAVI